MMPLNVLFVNPNARLTKFPKFPINSELILVSNCSQSKFKSSCEYGLIEISDDKLYPFQ